MKHLIAPLVLIMVNGSCSATEADVVLLGHYSSLQVTRDEDAHILSGYAVSLYKDRNVVFGDLEVGVGSTEAAGARLYDIHFDSATRKIRFKADYSTGREHSKAIGPGGRDSRVVMTFNGTLARDRIIGTVQLRDGHSGVQTGTKTRVVMNRTYMTYRPDSFAQWAAKTQLDAN